MAGCAGGKKKGYKDGGKVFSGISKETEKSIEDAVSEAMSDPKKNPTSKYNTLKGRNNTLKRKKRSEMARSKNKSIPKDPVMDKNALRRKSVGELGTDVGTAVGMRYNRADGLTPDPSARKFAKGGKVFPDLNNDGEVTRADILKGRGVEGFYRGGDVRVNPKRGKCY